LVIIKETTISFQAKHPNLDLTFEIFTLEEKTQKNIITSKTPNMKRKKNSNLIKENQMFIIITTTINNLTNEMYSNEKNNDGKIQNLEDENFY
jgi:hypothetical protein